MPDLNLLSYALKGPQFLLMVLISILGCRGRGIPVPLVSLLVAFEILGCVALPLWREQRRDWLRSLWQDFGSYSSGGPIPWAGLVLLIVLPSGLILNLGDHCAVIDDTKPVIQAAVSLVHSGDVELSEQVSGIAGVDIGDPKRELPYYLRRTPHGIYSAYPSGMMVFAVPTVLLARLTGADLDHPRSWGMEKWTASWVAAGCLGLFFLLALHQIPPAPAVVMTLLLASGSVLSSTVGQALWQHGGTVFCSLALLLLEFQHQRRPSRRTFLLQGLAAGLGLACRLSFVLFLVPCAVWILIRAPRRAVGLGLVSLVAYAPWAIFYSTIYGTPWGPSSAQMRLAHWSLEISEGILGTFVSPARGMIVYQPWLLLLAAWIPWMTRPWFRTTPPAVPSGCGACCLVACTLHLALVSTWQGWWGGHCWGSRLASEVVVLGGLGCLRPTAWLWDRGWGRWLLLGLFVVSASLHLPAVYGHADQWNRVVFLDENPESLWSWARAPFLFPFEASLR